MSFSFLFGVLFGCTGTFAIQFLIQNFSKNISASGKKQIKKDECSALFNVYPDFLNRIKNDIKNPAFNSVREFFVVEEMAIMNSSVPRLRYDLSDDILPALNKLEQLDYIARIPNDSLLYKIHDEFIQVLKSMN